MTMVVSFRPTSASRTRSPLPTGARERTFQVPGAAKNRNSPSGLVTTSAVTAALRHAYGQGHLLRELGVR